MQYPSLDSNKSLYRDDFFDFETLTKLIKNLEFRTALKELMLHDFEIYYKVMHVLLFKQQIERLPHIIKMCEDRKSVV
jgi:hypothetical protein